MANSVLHTPSRHTFSCDGTQRLFPIPSYIISQDYVRIEIDGVLQSDRKKWDIVNNSLVFIDAPSNGSILDVQVASDSESLGELGMISNVDIVAQNITQVSAVGSNIEDVINVSNNINTVTEGFVEIKTVADNIDSVNTNASNIYDIVVVANISDKVVDVSDIKTEVSSVASIKDNVTTVANIESSVVAVANNETNINEVAGIKTEVTTVASIKDEIILIKDNLEDVKNAGENAINTKLDSYKAEAHRLTSNSYAVEPEDTFVKVYTSNGDGTFTVTNTTEYSALHWERKASTLVTEGIIDDATPAVDRTYSSSKVKEEFDNVYNEINTINHNELIGRSEENCHPISSIDGLESALNATEYINTISELRTFSNKDIRALNVLGYYTKGDGGGGVFYWDATSTETENDGTIIQATGVTTGRWKRVYNGTVNVKWFGAKGDGVTDDRQAFNKALQVSNSIEAPKGNIFLFDVTGGRSSAVEVISGKTVIINGTIKSNYGQLEDNAPTLFRVTGDNVLFYGGGSLLGNGTINALNTGTVGQLPSLIWIEGDKFTLRDVVIDSPSKAGIILYQCKYADISTKFKGGYTDDVYGETAYFGIYTYYGTYHKIHDCTFGLNDKGGKFVNSIFLVSDYCSITNNVAYSALEKLVYCAGSHNLIEGNSYYAPSPKNFTDAYRLMGDFNTLVGNYSIGANGGCQILNGANNRVINNTFLNCRQVGVNVNDNSYLVAGRNISGNEVRGNLITGISGVSFSGIQVVCSYSTANFIKISNNIIVGISIENGKAILVTATSPYSITNSSITHNSIINCYMGIDLYRVVYSEISYNNLKNITVYPLSEAGASSNSYKNNKCREVVYKGILGLSTDADFDGNTYTDAPLVGMATLVNNHTTIVAHGGVAPNAKILLQNANASAGLLQAIAGLFVVNTGDGSFSITVSSYGNAQGTEILSYKIIQ